MEKVNYLEKTIEGISAQTVLSCKSCQVNWTSVPNTLLGKSDLKEAATYSYTIPDLIPSYAREVLIYAAANIGDSSQGPYTSLKFFIQIGSNTYDKYLMLYSWNQVAFNSNSENMWFPMPPNRRVYLTVPEAYGHAATASISVIGYR